MPEAVVRPAALRVGQHLVRLGDRAESHVGIGLLADVGVELTRQLPERALDLGMARVAGHAEQLVVVLLRRRHQGAPYTSSARRESSNAAARTERIAFS